MTNALLKLLAGLLWKLMTQAAVGKMIVYICQAAAKKTDNNVDDKLVATVAEAWDVSLEK
jgi:hypothetical protein